MYLAIILIYFYLLLQINELKLCALTIINGIACWKSSSFLIQDDISSFIIIYK